MNDFYEARIKTYIREHGIRAEHLTFEQSCHSVADAARAVNAAPEDFVKNICLIAPEGISEGRLLVAIVKGEDRVSLANVLQAAGLNSSQESSSHKLRLASAQEILERTGYPCGGTPSFGFEAEFWLDERIFEKEVVYTGGGSEQALIKVSPYEIQRANGGLTARLRK
jgi:prolyl-tRNA editing enzyme YbaK/EbsC (Cys-tRNA(Pro) deacylase)